MSNETLEALPGRSLRRGEVTLDELRALTEPFDGAASLLAEELGEYDAVVVEGDLTLPELDTYVRRLAVLVVTGNLRVEGTYQDYGYPATGVFVLGDLQAENVITEGTLGVSGDLIARHALVGAGNDYSATIAGTASARVFVPENHHFEVGTEARFEIVFGWAAPHRISKKVQKGLAGLALRDAVVSEIHSELVQDLDDDDIEKSDFEDLIEYSALVQRIAKGQPILR